MTNQSFRNFIEETSSYHKGSRIFYSYAVLVMMYPLVDLNCNAHTKALTLILSKSNNFDELQNCLTNLGAPDCKVKLLVEFVKEQSVYLTNFTYLETPLYWEYIFKCPDLRYQVCDRPDFQRASQLGCILSQIFSDISLLDKLVEQVQQGVSTREAPNDSGLRPEGVSTRDPSA